MKDAFCQAHVYCVCCKKEYRAQGGHVTKSVFFEKTYQDAIQLLERAHGYAESDLPRHLERMEPFDALRTSAEVMRITARLSQVMTWLMAQKAADAGLMSIEEASGPEYKPTNEPTCADATDEELLKFMPSMVGTLLDESLNLYVRVARLSDLHARQEEN
ncbi:MAG: DUF1465 domain-containing protein [Candidatus Puniceispirillum sp.]|nr:DUF1465 domain-containing protein [Candidatus Puniceispirillum sp.]